MSFFDSREIPIPELPSNEPDLSSEVEKKRKNSSYLEEQPHHRIRHAPDAKKPPKHSMDEDVIHNTILSRECECSRSKKEHTLSCYTHFSVQDVILAREKFDYREGQELTTNEILVKIVNYLQEHSLEKQLEGSHRIG